MRGIVAALACAHRFVTASHATAQTRIERNVVYGMYSGLALLTDVHHPEKPKRRARRQFTEEFKDNRGSMNSRTSCSVTRERGADRRQADAPQSPRMRGGTCRHGVLRRPESRGHRGVPRIHTGLVGPRQSDSGAVCAASAQGLQSDPEGVALGLCCQSLRVHRFGVESLTGGAHASHKVRSPAMQLHSRSK